MHREHPVSLDVNRADESVTAGLLRAGDVIGAVTSDPVGVRGCETVPLGSLRYFAVAAPEFVDYWLPNGVRARDLAYAPMMMFDINDQLQRKALKQLVAQPISPPVNYVPSSAEYRRAIAAGIGWGAVPEVEFDDEFTGRNLVKLSQRPVDVPLFWQHWRLQSPAVAALTEIVVDHARRGLVPPRARPRKHPR